MGKSVVSRREFLLTTAGAAAASVAAKQIILEPEPLFASSRIVPPGDRVLFGIVGVGMQGTGLLTTAIALPGVECVAAGDLYDGRHELAKEIAGKSIRTTRYYKDLLDDKEIDAIIVAVPDHWHKQIVVDSVGRQLVKPIRDRANRPDAVLVEHVGTGMDQVAAAAVAAGVGWGAA